jgi:hypothetical protein
VLQPPQHGAAAAVATAGRLQEDAGQQGLAAAHREERATLEVDCYTIFTF